jgi:hypothetical protein
MQKLVSSLALFTLLTACSTYAPGEDQKGVQMQTIASKVLVALRTYMDDNAREPQTLQQLVPKYLPAIPTEPEIHFDPKGGRLEFSYQQVEKNGMLVNCHAALGETEWVCLGAYAQPKTANP